MKDECLAFSHFITVDVSVCSHILMFQLTPQTCYSIFHGSSVVSRWKWVHLNYCIPQTIFIHLQGSYLTKRPQVFYSFSQGQRLPFNDQVLIPVSVNSPSLSPLPSVWFSQPQLQLRVSLLFSPVIYCSPPPLAVQPSIFTTFLPGEQQQQHLALPAARRQVPQVDLGRESGGSLSAASSSMDLLLPCAVAAVSAIDSCASGGLCLQPVDMHGLADCTCSSILVEMQNEQL